MKTKVRTIRLIKYCALAHKHIYLVQEQSYANHGCSTGGVWLPGIRWCEDGLNCTQNCKWAIGATYSEVDPMISRAFR